jgi:pyruvate kinase
MDTKGPEVRTTALADGRPIPYVTGETVKIFGDQTKEPTKENIYVSYA